ncbi:uncharacterized protein [Physcomitrium patens]|uniref:uncharacterized protein isoform X5 n=1 Tax=Physcomitrium patens TaxID=3218 RepID=UPI003CCD35F6
MEKLGLPCCVTLLLVLWIIARPSAGQTPEEQERFLDDKEKKVRLLAQHALFLQLAAESTDCVGRAGLSNCVDKCSRHSCLPTLKDHFTCVQAPRNVTDCRSSGNSSGACLHMNVDFTRNGFVRVPPQFRDYSNLSPELTRAICSQSNLQFPASSESIFNELTFWNYFGSAEGAWRTYPGREADPEKGCIEYDPRKRPWYISAISVVKDLVVLLDTGQVNGSTFTNTKTVIHELFGTFRPDDRINLVTFNSTSATLLQSTSVIVKKDEPVNQLYNTFKIPSLLNTPYGFSNITRGFATARTAFNSTSLLKMIVVLTDGNFARSPGFNNDTALQQMVASLSLVNVIVFFFNLGANTVPDPLRELRNLSCQMNSTVTYVSPVDAQRNPLWALRPFFDYQATLRQTVNNSFWIEPYEDFDGLGLVATVTNPVMHEGILYGVAGIDVVVKSDVSNAIKRRVVDGNVGPLPLVCQPTQVNLTKCTKPVGPEDKAICPQSMYLNDPPTEVYLKNLCCNNCVFQGPPQKDITMTLLAAIIPALLVLIIIIFAYFILKRRAARSIIRETKEDFARQSIATNQYSYKELKACTQKFHEDKKLGEGGFGEVYQGKLKDGSLVAVKKLSENSKQGAREFLNEVMVISRVQHRNLVKLRGCCVEGRHRLLVYEFQENRSLRQAILGGPNEAIDVNWETRFNIALGTAREEQSHFTTNVAGTLGYVAPEYGTRGQLTEKVDVFSYGVVLMEIVTGELNRKRTPSGSLLFLVDRVRCMYKMSRTSHDEQVLVNLLDSRLDENFDTKQVLRVLKTALLCTLDTPEARPTTPHIITMLLGSEPIDEDLLLPLVKLEYSKSLHAVDYGLNEEWSGSDEPPLLSEVSSRR